MLFLLLSNVEKKRKHTLKNKHRVGDISIIFPCSFAVGITQQYGIYVLLGQVICTARKHSRRSCTDGVQKYICIVNLGTVTNTIETHVF